MSRHIPRIYSEQKLSQGGCVRLGNTHVHHLLQVLRLKTGAELILFDGRGGEYTGSVAAAGKDWIDVRVGAHQPVHRESRLQITLAQAISRGERMDYTLQKSVELGVHNIQPLDTERSLARLEPVRQDKKLKHWQDVVRAAAEQSGRERVPQVHAIQSLAMWLQDLPVDSCKLILDPKAQTGPGALSPSTDIHLLSGPEGGLSDVELQLAIQAGFTGIRLGPRILRTETAAVACLAVLQSLWGDFGK